MEISDEETLFNICRSQMQTISELRSKVKELDDELQHIRTKEMPFVVKQLQESSDLKEELLKKKEDIIELQKKKINSLTQEFEDLKERFRTLYSIKHKDGDPDEYEYENENE